MSGGVISDKWLSDAYGCPSCSSTALASDNFEWDTIGCTVTVWCLDCSARWVEYYRLVGAEYVELVGVSS